MRWRGGGGAPPPRPSATTTDAVPIAIDNAVINGDVNPNGLATTAWFEYGTDALLMQSGKTVDQAIGTGTTPVPIDQPITNLVQGTTYYYRVAAQNSAGTSRGTISSFSAALLPPTVSTSAANPVSNDNAVLNGDVNPNGLCDQRLVRVGDRSESERLDHDFQAVMWEPGRHPCRSTAPLTNLTPGTTYYFRVAAQNTAGTSKGTIRNFKPSQIPSATTNAATSVTSIGATLNGSVNPNGLQTNYWFVWGTDPTLTNPVLTTETPMQGISGRNVHRPAGQRAAFRPEHRDDLLFPCGGEEWGRGAARDNS